MMADKDILETIRENVYKELNKTVKRGLKNGQWVTETTTSETVQAPPDSYIGQLHFDLDSNELFVTIRGRKGKEEKVKIDDINDFKKLATKKLLRR